MQQQLANEFMNAEGESDEDDDGLMLGGVGLGTGNMPGLPGAGTAEMDEIN